MSWPPPSVEAAKTFLRERNKEWLLHWYKVEREILDPERELPLFQLGKNLLRFEGGYRPFRLSCDSLKTMMKEECLAAIVHSMLSYTDNVLLDVQWKKIKDPAAFLLATPDNTPVLVTSQYGVKLLPKAIRKVAEALDYLRKLGKV
jgi:hypothetical protein